MRQEGSAVLENFGCCLCASQRRDTWIGASGRPLGDREKQDIRKQSSKARLERKTLATFCALCKCEHTTLKKLLGTVCVALEVIQPSRALGNTFVFGQSAKRVVVAS